MFKIRKFDNITAWIVFAIASLSYILTIEPTASFWDCGEFITTAYNLEVGHPPGAPFFMIMGRFFSLFASDTAHVAMMVNIMSAICSGFTIFFLYLSISHITRRIFYPQKDDYVSLDKLIIILGSGVVGSLCYAYSDTFWFSAVEGEVYAMSSLFTALVFWCALKYEESTDKNATRWLILICYLMGLSIGVHLLNLLAIPAIVLVFYYKHYKTSLKGSVLALLLSFAILIAVLYGIIPGVFYLASRFELLFTNVFGCPYNTGAIVYCILGVGALIWGLYYTQKNGKKIFNFILLGITVIIIGYSSFAMIVIRSMAEPPMDENNPDNVFAIQSYLNREQYGDRPLFKGEYYNSPVVGYEQGSPSYAQRNGKYEIIDYKTIHKYDPNSLTVFPRMYSSEEQHVQGYKYWTGIKDDRKPSFVDNLKFFFDYQVGYMYFRYLFWNFVGRQNDIQGHDENVTFGNWISGINFIDDARLGDQDLLPSSLKNNKGRNTYYFLPLILGILGMIYLFTYNGVSKQYFWVVMLFFLLTGLAIIVYLNQTPYQPRERDYGYAGSFYAFAMYVGLAVAFIAELFKKLIGNKGAAIFATIFCLLSSPVLMAKENWDDHDRSNRYTARDFAINYLESCAPNAILFTNGDNDTFPLWYAQEVEGIRTDVRVVNLAYFNASWYINQMRKKAYESDPLPISIDKSKYDDGVREVCYINDNPNLFLNQKFESDSLFLKQFDAFNQALKQIVDNSNFRNMQPLEYQALMNNQLDLVKFSRLIAILAQDYQKYGVNKNYIDQLKQRNEEFLKIVASKGHVELSNILDFVCDDGEHTKIMSSSGEKYNYSPTANFALKVDKQKVLQNGTVPQKDANKILDVMTWTFPSPYIRKGDLMVLDILRSNNWERPVYFAITVGSAAYMGLDKFFRLDGFTYRLVPIAENQTDQDRGYVNTDILYDNVMNKFKFGGIDNPKVYLDENNNRLLMNLKSTFARLSLAFLQENNPEKAVEVMDYCYKVMPFDCVLPSYYDMYIAENYLKANRKDKAHEVFDQVANQTLEELEYYFSLPEDKAKTVVSDRYRSMAVAHEICRLSKDLGDKEYCKKVGYQFLEKFLILPLISSFKIEDIYTEQFSNFFASLSETERQIVQIYITIFDTVANLEEE